MLLINRKEMSFVFKHRDASVCNAERITGIPYVLIDETDPNSFKALTVLEMRLLYRNLGQVAGTNLADPVSIRTAIIKLLKYRLESSPSAKGSLPLFVEPVQKVENGVPIQTAPKGQTSNLIWDVADEIWINEGSPKDLKLVLSIRKKIMQELETAHGVKKNTASNELGKWQKARI